MSARIALVIGNSEYEDPKLARLVTPHEDVNDLSAVLRNPAIGGFDNVVTLVNESAPAIRRAIGRLFAAKSPDDLLLLYFSGHGVRDDRGLLFLAVQDTEVDLLNATAIPAAFVTDEMDRSRSRRQVLILDCCHSGAFAQGAKGVPGLSVGTATAFAGTGYGRVVLTATDSTQYAWEGDRLIGNADNSVFTHFMIDGLRTGAADLDGDGEVTLDELYDYVYAQIVQSTSRQTPRKFAYNQQGDVVIAHNPSPVPRRVALPPELRSALESPLPGVREGVVGELDRLLRSSDRGLAASALEALEKMTEDDSRRVSAAAAARLAAFGAAAREAAPPQPMPTWVVGPPGPQGPPAPPASEPAEPEPAGGALAEGPAAAARPEAAKKVAAALPQKVEPFAPARAEPPAPEPSQSLAPAEPASVPLAPAAETLARPATPAPVAGVPAPNWVLAWGLGFPLLVIGWSAGFVLGDQAYYQVKDAGEWVAGVDQRLWAEIAAWLVTQALCGLAMVPLLALASPQTRRRSLLGVVLGWSLAGLAGWAVYHNLYQTTDNVLSMWIGGLVVGLVGGAVLYGLVLRRARWAAGWLAGLAALSWPAASFVSQYIPNDDGSPAVTGAWLALLGGGAFLSVLTLGHPSSARFLSSLAARLGNGAGGPQAAAAESRAPARWATPAATAPGLGPALQAWQPVWLPTLITAVGWGVGYGLYELFGLPGMGLSLLAILIYLVFQGLVGAGVAAALRVTGWPVGRSQLAALARWTIVTVVVLMAAALAVEWLNVDFLGGLWLAALALQPGLVIDSTLLRGVAWARPEHRWLAVAGWALPILIVLANPDLALNILLGAVGGGILFWLLHQARAARA